VVDKQATHIAISNNSASNNSASNNRAISDLNSDKDLENSDTTNNDLNHLLKLIGNSISIIQTKHPAIFNKNISAIQHLIDSLKKHQA
jgi:hypothetical protein